MKILFFFFCFASVKYIFGVVLPVPVPVIVVDVVDAVVVDVVVDVVDDDAAERKPTKNNKPHQNKRKRKRKRKKKPNEKNNILLLLTDDQDILLGSFNTKKYMPIVQKQLIEMGVTFEQGALTHVPICCPSRSSILTGKYLHTQQGMAINNSITGNCYGSEWKTNIELNSTYAVYAQQAGYTTMYAGKYLNQYKYNKTSPESSIPNGWDYWYGLEGNSRYYNYSIVEHSPEMISRDGLIPPRIQIHKHSDTYPDDYLPLVLQEYTLEKLATLPEPWLAVIAWPTPHGPFTPEPKYEHDYPDVNPPNSMPNYNATEDSMKMKHWLLRQLGIITNETALQINDIYRNRLRTLKTVDNHIGKIIKLLKKMKQKTTTTVSTSSSSSTSSSTSSSSTSSSTSTSSVLDRTVIIYTSDNGFQFGQHRLAIDKRHLYEHDVRVPFVVRGPSNPASPSNPSLSSSSSSFKSSNSYDNNNNLNLIPQNITISKDVIVSLIDIAPTILTIILNGLDDELDDDELEDELVVGVDNNNNNNNNNNNSSSNNTTTTTPTIINNLQNAIKKMDGHSFWNFLIQQQQQQQQYKNKNNNKTTKEKKKKKKEVSLSEDDDYDDDDDTSSPSPSDKDDDLNNDEYIDDNILVEDDPFIKRIDILISYHGEGNSKCNISECPPPYLNNNQLWWMPDSYNNTYHCVRTISKSKKSNVVVVDTGNNNVNNEYNVNNINNNEYNDNDNNGGENSIYCIFYDDEQFVEYYDLNTNPYQLGNDYKSLNKYQIQRYEKRLQELLT